MRAEPPWSPTGVAIGEGSSVVHVLEVAHVEGDSAGAAVPRVRSLALPSPE
jgi:hypothetical protein